MFLWISTFNFFFFSKLYRRYRRTLIPFSGRNRIGFNSCRYWIFLHCNHKEWWRARTHIYWIFCTSDQFSYQNFSNIYYINDNLDKRTWTYLFGACCATTVFIPSFHNYRIWSFLGLLMTTYTAWYLTIASFIHGQV